MRLNTIYTTINGYAFKKSDFLDYGKIPIIKIANITKDGINLNNCKYTNNENLRQYKALNGDIIIALSGATTGKMSFYNSDNTAYINQRTMILRQNFKLFNAYLLFNFVYTKTKEILQNAYGGAQPNISSQEIEDMLIPFPPNKEQERIYLKLLSINKNVFDLKNCVDSVNNIKTAIKNKILDAIFGENSSYKSYYENKKLYEICDVIMGQSPEGDSITNIKSEKSIEFHQGKLCFGSYNINFSNKYSSKCNKICEENSLLFSVRAPVGDINYTDRKIGIGRGLCAIKPKKEHNIKFLYYQLLYMKSYFISKSTGSTFKAITVDTIKNCEIKQAKTNIQDKIVYFLDNAFKLIDEL